MPNKQNGDRILKAAWENGRLHLEVSQFEFQLIPQPRLQKPGGLGIYKQIPERKQVPTRLLYPVELFFKTEDETKTFHDKPNKH